ncbi:MAG: glycosyltransferase [Flavobacteriaceae bacterium]|nr:glycosyltransferase [Flavobacteriaceae bacterium]
MIQNLVSILTPFKNTSAYISECISSIIKQTYQNWELLIVDDGSTDDSKAIVTNFANKDIRIRLLDNPGQGIIEALRFALQNSKGQYVTRMDSDDIMPIYKLEHMVNALKQYGDGHIAVGLVKYFSETKVTDGYRDYEQWLNGLTQKGHNFNALYKECVIPSPCWMTSRQDLLRCDAFNPNRYPEDYDLTFRFYKYGLKCIPCDTLWHHWRDYSKRTSKTHVHYDIDYFLDLKLHYFLELHYEPSRPLVIMGAGYKGKLLAKSLLEANITFHWINDNPNKQHKNIYHQSLKSMAIFKTLDRPQSIITLANAKVQNQFETFMNRHNMIAMQDYFFFC